MTNVKIAPSLLSADFGRLQEEVAALEAGGADYLHLDIMDGVFVPNISVGLPVVEAVRKSTRLPLDVHLMIVRPENLVPAFLQAGADILTIHFESTPNLHRTLAVIRAAGKKAGLAINPGTPSTVLAELISEADLFLVMSVNPGFGGQGFIPFTLEKIRKVRELITSGSGSPELEVDGGIKLDNIEPVVRAGADVLVSGSGILGKKAYRAIISEMRERAERARLPEKS